VALYAGWHSVAFEGDNTLRRVVLESAAGEHRTVDTDVAFVELGLRPRTGLVQGWVTLDPAGRVIVDGAAATNVPGLFAAGDVTNVPAEQVLIAIGEGAKAALSAYEYLLRVALWRAYLRGPGSTASPGSRGDDPARTGHRRRHCRDPGRA
jgi:alkyl hydroperoxide reductase subunit AhpF